ncbi:hypothetical protein AUC71_02885 [Methyloceanibacter marginalis]|uniref:Uncharacterized protein n=1 Tax=Methyloceanibacter marginalis TaxID=1774971 RepID=A0A1E3W9T6_9HYPH|nr:hypothetical protein AUC71_02885 [Methyloceanibacter marginalis]
MGRLYERIGRGRNIGIALMDRSEKLPAVILEIVEAQKTRDPRQTVRAFGAFGRSSLDGRQTCA